MKSVLRQSYAEWASKQRKEEIENLRNALIILEIEIINGKDVFNEYQETKFKLYEMMQAVADKFFKRSMAMCTQYFLQLKIWKKHRTKSVRTLITENGSIADPQKIPDEQKLFYKRKYT